MSPTAMTKKKLNESVIEKAQETWQRYLSGERSDFFRVMETDSLVLCMVPAKYTSRITVFSYFKNQEYVLGYPQWRSWTPTPYASLDEPFIFDWAGNHFPHDHMTAAQLREFVEVFNAPYPTGKLRNLPVAYSYHRDEIMPIIINYRDGKELPHYVRVLETSNIYFVMGLTTRRNIYMVAVSKDEFAHRRKRVPFHLLNLHESTTGYTAQFRSWFGGVEWLCADTDVDVFFDTFKTHWNDLVNLAFTWRP